MICSLSVLVTLAFLSAQGVFAQTTTSSGARQLGPRPGQIKNLVTFGDSYTDVVSTGDGGTAWPVYAAGYGNFKLFPFARSGATCSNNITFRPFPSLFESQIPAFLTQRANGTVRVNQAETIYTLWIGTNDVGSNALLTGSQPAGISVVDTTTCAVNWVKTLYDAGARNFLFQNVCSSITSSIFINLSRWTDDSSPRHRPLLRQILPEPLLDRPAQHNRVERLHGRAHILRKCDFQTSAPGARAVAARRTRRSFRLTPALQRYYGQSRRIPQRHGTDEYLWRGAFVCV